MNEIELRRAARLRAWLEAGRSKPCTCGECPTDTEIDALLELDDETLLEVLA